LLQPGTQRLYSARPEQLRETMAANPEKKTVVIDEVQRVPELLSLVHALVEEKQGWQFILTGSSARKLKKTGVDLLGGRAALCTMHPFMAAELGEGRFRLDAALRQGLLPVVLAEANPASVLNDYAALYIREEIQAEGLVRNIGGFSRFLEAVSFSHAALLNVANIGRECLVERKTVEGYLTILEDLLLAHRLPVFSKRAKRRLVTHSKLYLFDTGVFRSVRPAGPLDRPAEIDGAALEGLVFQHLRAWVEYGGQAMKLYFWRTPFGVEVDFVVYGENGFWAVEVKNTSCVRPEDLRPLQAFKTEYPECTPLFLYRGQDRLVSGGILCLPVEEFLLQVRPGRPLS
jgi:predicted AAA+ superfamily ATPase